MTYIAYERLVVTTTTSGAAAQHTARHYTGLVQAVRYVANATTSEAYSSGGEFVITGERTGYTVLALENPSTLAATYYPRSATVTTTGATSTGAALIPVNNERLLITVTSGATGDIPRTGTFDFYIG